MKGTKTLLSYILFIVGFQYKVICNLPPICEKDHFTCGNKDCVPKFWKCDGADDCGDGSDEGSDCPVAAGGEECDSDEMKCTNEVCIQSNWRCDSEDDCGDGSDEVNCTTTHQIRPCDESTNFRCGNGKCVPRSWTCNNVDDCGDNSDESTLADPHCIPFVGCKDGYFHCNTSGFCIHKVLVCDGNYNCGKDKKGGIDKSDELNCAKRTCEPDELKCDNGRCISKQWRCDKQNDCGDGSDERNCSIKACPADKFKCIKSGHCIDRNFQCDQFHDCLDGSDEIGCKLNTTTSTKKLSTTIATTKPYTLVTTKTPSVNPTKKYTLASTCKPDEYSCKNESKCLHRSWICDGDADCQYMDDESPELCSTPKCESDHFKCDNKRCIEKRNRCDGHDHCGDNSDEKNCESSQVPCARETHSCQGSHKCIPLSSVCDGKSDCPYHDDESPSCGTNECLKSNGNCSHICRDLSIGFKCECPKGYTLETQSKKCVDINECHIFGKCSQKCVNYKGYFACQCDQGYTMDSLDNRTCHAGDPMPYLVFTNRFDVRKISADGRVSKLLAISRSASALAVHYAEKMLYWADNGFKTISRTSVDGAGKAEVIIRNVQKPEALSLDWLGNKLYWTDLYTNRISVSNLDGSHSKIWYQGGIGENIRGIEVYPEKGYVFWTNWGGNSKIERANLDGSNKTIVLGKGLTWPTSLTIDRTIDRLYWTELSSICSVDINGKGIKEIIYGLSRPYGLAVFEDYIYWTDQVDQAIYKANKFNGQQKEKFNRSFTSPFGIAVYHPLVQKIVSHPCRGNNGGCSHLCFMTPDQRHVCSCPGVMTLGADERTCIGPIPTSIPPTTIPPTTIPPTTIPPTTEKSTTAFVKTAMKTIKVHTVEAATAPPKTTSIPKTEIKYTDVPTAKPLSDTLLPTKNEITLPTREHITLVVRSDSAPTEVTKTRLFLRTTTRPIVVAHEQLKEEGKSTVNIVVPIVCFIALFVIITIGVICFRKKRSQFDLSMVYESQRDVVHGKEADKTNVEKKYIVAAATKTKTFENVNFQNADGAVRIPLNTSPIQADIIDDYSADNSSEDVCFDDSAPIMQNML